MTNKLTNLEAVEVSLVPKGANKKKFLLLKQEGGFTMDEIMKACLELELENEQEVEEVLKAKKISPKAMSAVKGALRILSAFKDELPKDVMTTMAGLAGYSYAKPAKAEKQKKKPEEEEKEKKKLPFKKEDGTVDWESVPEEMRPALQMLWKENEENVKKHDDAVKKADELQKALEIEQQTRIAKEFLDKGNDFPNIGDAKKVGDILRKSYEVSDEYGKEVEEVLKTANDRIEKSLFDEIGSNVQPEPGAGAWGKIEELAKGIVQKNDSMTMAQAIDLILDQKPELYEEYQKEKEVK
jgi:hypothetical protein